ncbi:phenylalanine--tRNA ligase subunit alpha [Bartonella sp. DGB1]|uniref:phenylalanine--tRNA ligase subunit alpha n=1 Tax=Bartonella sp. DGB1 TaxID=3239807 RepID=UPI0035237030
MADLNQLKNDAIIEINNATDESSLEAVRVNLLGKKGIISEKLKELGRMTAEDRQIYGPILNQLKDSINEAIVIKRNALKQEAMKLRLEKEKLDITLSVSNSPLMRGYIHPLTKVMEEMQQILQVMGFDIAVGPDIENDYYNFTALNFPEGHPAREMHDTFFFNDTAVGEKKLLRTHTSPVQIHTMESRTPPIRVMMPGKTYRVDSDATHSPMFHQLEGLLVDKNTNIAQLKWLLEEFCKSFFEVKNLKMRFRPSFFPFTEPSLEVDIQCKRDNDGNIYIGEGENWLEVLGCGMVNPNVLRFGGIDPDVYQGFAWGMGIDRFAMLKYGMSDLRAFFNGDIRWLSHYGFRPLDLPSLLLNNN